ncbi:MAG: DUF1287 domain-containing protein [Candidatus Thiodiazotropha lotti]
MRTSKPIHRRDYGVLQDLIPISIIDVFPIYRDFFERNAIQLSVSHDGGDYKSGDIVTWLLPGNLPHLGIVTDKLSTQTGLPLIVHNIGSEPVVEDMLFHHQITAHYHYLPQSRTADID